MSTSASPRPSGGTKGATTSRPVRRSSTRDAQEDLVRAVPKAKVRRARLQLSRIDPWSVLKLAFLLSVALGVLTVVAAIGIYTLGELTGVFGLINDVLGTILGADAGTYTVESLAPLSTVVSLATVAAVLNVIMDHTPADPA